MNFKSLLYLPLLILIMFTSCQNEDSDIINQQDSTISGNSTLANLISNTALNDGSLDNIIDYANCLEVVLPVTVSANGITITIQSVTDYQALETVLEAFTNDDDQVEINFPITVIFSDYTQIIINNQEELEAQIENCNGENEIDDDIECVDFQYPIAFSIYNTDFQVTEVITINNDEALYQFLETLDGPVLASLNFPVTLILSNGETIEVNSNQELEVALSQAENDCDEDDDYNYNDDDCTEDAIELALKECLWEITHYNTTDSFNNYYLEFNADYQFTATYNGTIVHEGNWSVIQNGDGNFLIDFGTDWQDINGAWIIDNCDDDYEYNLYNMSNQSTMQIEQECDVNPYNPFQCFEDTTYTVCDNDDILDLITTFDINEIYQDCINSDILIGYYNTNNDAINNINQLASPYTNVTNPETFYVRVELANNPNEFEVYTVTVIIEDCTTTCTEGDVDGTLQNCVWTISNFAGDNGFNIFNINFEDNQNMTISSTTETYTGNWSTSEVNGQVMVSFSNISGGNVQVLNGDFIVVECTGDQMILHDVNNSFNELVLDIDCT